MLFKGIILHIFLILGANFLEAQEWVPKVGISYRGLAVLSDKEVWASGTKGTVVKTENGGKTWRNISVIQAKNKDFRDIQVWDSKNALVMSSGDSAEFYKTSNGGKTWVLVYKNYTPGIFFDAMDFKGNSGVFIGDPIKGSGFFTLLTFNKVDKKFIEVQLKLNGFDDSLNSAFAASGTCITYLKKNDFAFCTGSGNKKRGKFYRVSYNEKVKTIEQTELPFFIGNYAGAYSMCSASNSVFIVVGGSFLDTNKNDSVGAYTKDGGVSWNLCTGLGGYRSCVQIKKKFVVATGTNGSDCSVDGGKTFREFEKTGYNTCMIGTKYIWFAGDKGRLLKRLRPYN